jgi:hypothetical protein
MRSVLTVLVLVAVLLFGCDNLKTVVPFTIKGKVSSNHCFPYNVSVYKIDDVIAVDKLNTYPKQEFCRDDKFESLDWKKFSDYKDDYKDSLVLRLQACDGDTKLYNEINQGDEIYISGCYRNKNNGRGETVRLFDRIAFLNASTKKLYILKDMQVTGQF